MTAQSHSLALVPMVPAQGVRSASVNATSLCTTKPIDRSAPAHGSSTVENCSPELTPVVVRNSSIRVPRPRRWQGPRLSLMLTLATIATYALQAPGASSAADMKVFVATKGVPALGTVTLSGDYGIGGKLTDFSVTIAGGMNGLTPTNVATALTNFLNTNGSGTIAAQNGTVVTMLTANSVSITPNPTATIFQEGLSSAAPLINGYLAVNANAAGNDSLLSTGQFAVTGPGGLNVSFNLAESSSGDAVALAFASAMTFPGYSVDPVGSTVFFQTTSPGTVAFQVDGDGFDYVVGSVPEPSSLVLAGVAVFFGTVIGLARMHWDQRRRTRDEWKNRD
jgi:PEP-CTERM motif